MTWLELRDWAWKEEKRLSDLDHWRSVDWPDPVYMERWLKRREKIVDESVEHFLITGRWGELARDDRPALFYRLMWATQLLSLIAMGEGEVIPELKAPEVTAWRWVLIETWRVFGMRTVSAWLGTARKPPKRKKT
jgi:hypothetical protein